MQWGAVNLDKGTMTLCRSQRHGRVGPTKNGKDRLVPLPPELVAVLKEWRTRQLELGYPGFSEGWIFATKNDDDEVKLRFPSSLGKALAAWGREAGIGRKVTPHLFRHSWVSAATEAGLDPMVRMAIVGHVGLAVHGRYTTVRPDVARQGQAAVVRLVVNGGEA